MGPLPAFETVAPDYEPMQFWTTEEDTGGGDLAGWLATQGGEGYSGADGDGAATADGQGSWPM